MSNVPKRLVRRLAYFTFAALLVSPCAMPSMASADETFNVVDTVAIPVPGTTTPSTLTSFDISWVDPFVHAYFLADRSNKSIDVIDTKSHAVIHQFTPGFVGFTGNNNTSGPNGVMTIFNRGKVEVWVGDGGSKVWVLDYPSGNVLHTIATGGVNRADEMCYDPAHHLVEVANDADTPPYINYIATEGPQAYQVVAKIQVPEATNGLEQCQWSERTNLIYANVPEVNGSGNDTTDGNVYVIDARTTPPKIVRKFDIPVAQCAGPQGMALGPLGQILLGCNAIYPFDANCNAVTPCPPGTVQNAAVIDQDNGRIIQVLENEGGADEVWYNPGDGHYFLADGSHLPNEQLGVVDSFPLIRPDPSVVIGNAGVTTRRAHSVAADPETREVFLPVPGTGGGSPGFTSTTCGALAVNGCIAILKSDEPHF
jgi:hypothetical protein